MKNIIINTLIVVAFLYGSQADGQKTLLIVNAHKNNSLSVVLQVKVQSWLFKEQKKIRTFLKFS